MEYNEEEILIEYVWRNCSGLMNEVELLGLKAVSAREKSESSSDRMVKMILDKWGSQDNPEVQAALSKGLQGFRKAVKDRVIRDHPDIVNRCPMCNRVARTPKSKQCPWCFHDWH